MTTTALDPRFAKAIALMRSTTHDGARQSARRSAELIAQRSGMTFDQALKILDARNVPPASFAFLSGFDDWMEKQEPGWKAKRAGEKAGREQQRLARRAAIIARYGSEAAALAPCAREQLLLVAVKAWRRTRPRPWHRWTDNLDGYSYLLGKPPAHVRDAIASAYPLPATFREAKAEHDHWRARRDDFEDVLGAAAGDNGLDLTAQIRAELVERLAEHALPTDTLPDLYERFCMMQESEIEEPEMHDALFRDLGRIVRSGGREGLR